MQTIERFLRYVAFPTMSDESSMTCPSTAKQLELGKYLTKELTDLGLSAELDAHGYVYATLAANTDQPCPSVGLIAHMDTSDACADAPIHPRTVLYDGKDIVLNAEENIVLSERDYPILKNYRGKHLIVTDGKTLLGADDKAGAAEIVSAVEDLIRSGKPHGTIRIGFTPDEEIGRGADLFDVKKFGADFAYTADGGTITELEYENFNAASAVITVTGRSIHPGSAKNQMINAARIACELQNLLPADQIPEKTEGYEGFIHLCDMKGDCEHAELAYIIRDHDRALFEEKKRVVSAAADAMNAKYGAGTVSLDLKDSYYNMKEVIEQHMEVIERAEKALRGAGVDVHCSPIRGGTDGARLSFMGLPCPNLPTGGENYHSRYEFACTEDMETMTHVLTAIMEYQEN